MRFLLYDFLQVAGGAERLTLTLARGSGDLQVVVARRYPEAERLLLSAPVEVRQLGDRLTRGLGRILEAAYCFKYRCPFLAEAELVVYSGFYAPIAVHQQRTGKRIYYCHTVPRFAYDQKHRYRNSVVPGARWLFDLAMGALRREYAKALSRMDVIVANSENVRRRLRDFLGLDAVVIHPPIDAKRFRWLGSGDYYVSLARLVPYKRVDIVVEAFRRMPDRKLVVISGGPELGRLQRLAAAAPNIRFCGWVSDDQLVHYIGHARAAIYVPVDEDFGMSPVEAMAAGKPVIGVAEGGLLETIVDGETGVLIKKELTSDAIIAAVERLEAIRPDSMRTACEIRAKSFNEEAFLDGMGQLLGVCCVR